MRQEADFIFSLFYYLGIPLIALLGVITAKIG